MESNAGYKKLITWQKADELVLLIYEVTGNFPKTEIYSLTSQVRRSALSVPTNIVEGYSRNSRSEFRRFVVIALGSLAETKYLLFVALRLKYLSNKDYDKVINVAESVGQLLWKFYKSLL
jgi:four helix bundle protein